MMMRILLSSSATVSSRRRCHSIHNHRFLYMDRSDLPHQLLQPPNHHKRYRSIMMILLLMSIMAVVPTVNAFLLSSPSSTSSSSSITTPMTSSKLCGGRRDRNNFCPTTITTITMTKKTQLPLLPPLVSMEPSPWRSYGRKRDTLLRYVTLSNFLSHKTQ